MSGFNAMAEKHPCMACEYGRIWTEMGKAAGNVCKHPEIIRGPGLYYGRYHSLKNVPTWCPIKEADVGESYIQTRLPWHGLMEIEK